MNQLSNQPGQELARIREVVARVPFPAFVEGFDIRLGEFDGDPALWVIFQTKQTVGPAAIGVVEQSRLRRALVDSTEAELREVFAGRIPYFRFEHRDAEQ